MIYCICIKWNVTILWKMETYMILVFCTKGPHVHWKITNKNSNLDQLGKHNDTLLNNARNTEILKVSWSVYMEIGMEQYLI